jgi:hypothetical protein
MNIIFGNADIEQLSQKYIVLELDTITIEGKGTNQAFCIIENMSLDNLPKAEPYKKLHADLMANYKNRNWDFCIDALAHLREFWGSEMTSFYDVLEDRIKDFQLNPPDASWTSIIQK